MDDVTRREAMKLTAAAGAVVSGATPLAGGSARGQDEKARASSNAGNNEGARESTRNERLESIREDKEVMDELTKRVDEGNLRLPYRTRVRPDRIKSVIQGDTDATEATQRRAAPALRR